jgi:hypothetical protein
MTNDRQVVRTHRFAKEQITGTRTLAVPDSRLTAAV